MWGINLASEWGHRKKVGEWEEMRKSYFFLPFPFLAKTPYCAIGTFEGHSIYNWVSIDVVTTHCAQV